MGSTPTSSRRGKPIAHDPLMVRCLEEEYLTTFYCMSAMAPAHTLRAVRDGAVYELQHATSLPPEEPTALEHASVRASLDYARAKLGILKRGIARVLTPRNWS